ncbi:MAG: PEP/pyruvate-binding domain-containing protein, partial [Polyangiales bacterium]
MQLFEPIESIVPRRAQGYGEPIMRTVQLARAGLPVPGASALSRLSADAIYERVLAPEERLNAFLDPERALPSEDELSALRERILGVELDEELSLAASETFHTLRALGAPALFVVPSLTADRIDAQRWLTDVRFSVDSEERLRAALSAAFASPYELSVLRSLRAAGARDASVAVLVQSLVDGLVSGVVYTRHPITADAGEWLVRAGYGLASGVRRALVPSDVFRVSRDGYVRDAVIADKARMWVSGPDAERVLREVPAALATSQALSDTFLRDVLRLAERTERHLGYPVCIDWAIAQSKLYLLRSEALPGAPKIPRTRAQKSSLRERALWSHSE